MSTDLNDPEFRRLVGVAWRHKRERKRWWKINRQPDDPARKEPEMAYEQRDNSGTLFRNDRREKDTHPHAKGKALIGGVWYWVSAWTKEPRAGGEKFQSLSFEEMSEEHAGRQTAAQGQQGGSGGFGSRDDRARGAERPTTHAGRAEQRAVGARGRSPAGQTPYGEEKVFQSDDIPF